MVRVEITIREFTPADTWGYVTRNLTNPEAVSDLANMHVGLSKTVGGKLLHTDLITQLFGPFDLSTGGIGALTLGGTASASLTQRVNYLRLENAETTAGHDYAYRDLPAEWTACYIKAPLRTSGRFLIGLFDKAQLGTLTTAGYLVGINLPSAASDLWLFRANGLFGGAILASEGVDLASGVFYEIEMLYNKGDGSMLVWRDGVLKFAVTDTAVTTMDSLLFNHYGAGTYGECAVPLVVTT